MPHFARHTPQGAPTSPHISNLVCWSLDRRLSGLAKRFGARYTRYADDMAFSGGEDFKRGLARFIPLLRRIVAAEGFQLHEGKLRVLRAGQRQQVTGLVANVTPQPPRAEYDAVKAILHNARKGGGFYAQNRTGERDFLAHVRGRIAWIEQHNPRRGATLNRMLREVVAGLPRHAPPSER
jgi:retron-type reverse transcriptase